METAQHSAETSGGQTFQRLNVQAPKWWVPKRSRPNVTYRYVEMAVLCQPQDAVCRWKYQ